MDELHRNDIVNFSVSRESLGSAGHPQGGAPTQSSASNNNYIEHRPTGDHPGIGQSQGSPLPMYPDSPKLGTTNIILPKSCNINYLHFSLRHILEQHSSPFTQYSFLSLQAHDESSVQFGSSQSYRLSQSLSNPSAQ